MTAATPHGPASVAGPGNALFFSTGLLALSSVCATALCATAVCPFEAVRILSVRTGEPSVDVLRQQLQGPEGLASLYRAVVVISVVVCTALVAHALAAPYCDLAWDSDAFFPNAGLLFFSAMLFATYWLQLLALLKPPDEAACCGLGGRGKARMAGGRSSPGRGGRGKPVKQPPRSSSMPWLGQGGAASSASCASGGGGSSLGQTPKDLGTMIYLLGTQSSSINARRLGSS